MDDLESLKRLAGIGTNTGGSVGYNMGLSGTEKAKIMREQGIKPGTDEWFKLWFSRPQLTGEKPV